MLKSPLSICVVVAMAGAAGCAEEVVEPETTQALVALRTEEVSAAEPQDLSRPSSDHATTRHRRVAVQYVVDPTLSVQISTPAGVQPATDATEFMAKMPNTSPSKQQ